MIEKVNPSHPDKIADRIAGAIVDYAYTIDDNPKIAVEVLIGHGKCFIIAETSVVLDKDKIEQIVNRISEDKVITVFMEVPQDKELAKNQKEEMRCGDNGLFKGVPITEEERELSRIAHEIYSNYHSDGKYILTAGRYRGAKKSLIICQSCCNGNDLEKVYKEDYSVAVNPLGYWTGGTVVDTGATNRKLGSDMGEGVTGGGLHGKDLSKADVSVNIYAHLKAQELNRTVNLCCAIGDTVIMGDGVDLPGIPYSEVVEIARKYIKNIGGFEKFAEWGFI